MSIFENILTSTSNQAKENQKDLHQAVVSTSSQYTPNKWGEPNTKVTTKDSMLLENNNIDFKSTSNIETLPKSLINLIQSGDGIIEQPIASVTICYPEENLTRSWFPFDL